MRLLLLLILAGVGAYFTVPTQAQHEEAARAFLEARAGAPAAEGAEPAPFSLDSVVDFVTGMVAGFTSPLWASHSSAIASAIARVGTTSGALAGVFTGRPSSRTVNPPSKGSASALVQNRFAFHALI